MHLIFLTQYLKMQCLTKTFRQLIVFMAYYHGDEKKTCYLPVVKRSWVSARGLDSDMEGKGADGCEAGDREVEAGEDWVRTRGW